VLWSRKLIAAWLKIKVIHRYYRIQKIYHYVNIKIILMNKYLALGIESTAHTFSVSVVSSSGKVLSDEKDVYKAPKGSGIHPREASRHHSRVASKVLNQALETAKIKPNQIDLVSYSAGPGLGPCLRVGATVARTISLMLNAPLIPVNHAIGHIELGCILTGAKDPVTLLVSGGHTMILAYNEKRWRVLGETIDLTIGQLLDQLGRFAGYSSPAGRIIEELAAESNKYIDLPFTVKGNDVSFSGLLTAAKKMIKEGNSLNDVCFSVQETAFSMLTEVTERALALTDKKEVLITGGVAANTRLKNMLNDMCEERDSKVYVIPREYSGDCGAQIAWTGALTHKKNADIDVKDSWTKQSWRLDSVDVLWRE
jgi:N6-L-threonylcarbamoyladenine synthase